MEKWARSNERSVLKAHVFEYAQVDLKSPMNKQATFDVVKCPSWVNVIPVTDKKEVILVKQYRVGTDEVTLETPGGMVPRNESLINGVERELAEETGYVSTKVVELGKVSVNPAFMTNYCHFYVAYHCEKLKEQNLDPLEEIEIVRVPLTHIMPMIESGEIHHSLVVAAFALFFSKGLHLTV